MAEDKKGPGILQKLESARPTEIAVIPEVADRFKNLYQLMHRQNGEIRYESEKFHFMKILSDKPELQKCTKLSLYGCFLDAAVNGLSFDPASKHLYVVSFDTNVGTKTAQKWEKRATLMVSGVGELMMRMRQGQIRYADNPVVVYEGDHFKYGTDRTGFFVEHTAAIPRKTDNIIACYIRLERMDGTSDYKVLSIDEVQKFRNKSKSPNSLAWTDGLAGMVQAKVIKHAFRTYPRVQYGDFSKLATNEVEAEDQAPVIDYGIGSFATPDQLAVNTAAGAINNVNVHTPPEQVMTPPPAEDSFLHNNAPTEQSNGVVYDDEAF